MKERFALGFPAPAMALSPFPEAFVMGFVGFSLPAAIIE